MSRIGTLIVGSALLAGLAACASNGTTGSTTAGSAPVAPASTPTSPAPTATATTAAPTGAATTAPSGPGATIKGEREFHFTDQRNGKVLTVDSGGVLTVTGMPTDRSLFVTTPLAPGSQKFLMQTARMIQGGEPWCLQVRSRGGSEPLDLEIAACDAGRKDQIFSFPKKSDGKGLLIEVNGLYVLADTDDGQVVVQESGEGDAMSSFTVQDKGKANLPHLGD